MMGLSGSLASRMSGCLSLVDIATGLSRMPRFGGQTILRYSVAEHLLGCQQYTHRFFPNGNARLELAVLLHDAHEAMTCDVPTSFKTEDTRTLQKVLDRRIYHMLGLETPTPELASAVRLVDRVMLIAEAYILTPTATSAQIEHELLSGEHGHLSISTSRIFELAKFEGRVAVGHVLHHRGPGDDAVAEQYLAEVETQITRVRN